jgi:hypothetical protein
LEFFIAAAPNIAGIILDVLSKLSALYIAIRELRKKKEDTLLTADEEKEVQKLYEKIAKQRVEKFVAETASEIGKNAEPEKKLAVSTYLKILLKWLPAGIHIEVVLKKTPISGTETAPEKKAELENKGMQQLNIAEMYNLPTAQLTLPDPNGEIDEKPIENAPKERKPRKDSENQAIEKEAN